MLSLAGQRLPPSSRRRGGTAEPTHRRTPGLTCDSLWANDGIERPALQAVIDHLSPAPVRSNAGLDDRPSAGPVPVPVGPLTEDTALDQDRRLAFWPVPSDRKFIASADSERSNEVKIARVDDASVALPPAATAGLTFRWEVVKRQSPRGNEDQCR